MIKLLNDRVLLRATDICCSNNYYRNKSLRWSELFCYMQLASQFPARLIKKEVHDECARFYPIDPISEWYRKNLALKVSKCEAPRAYTTHLLHVVSSDRAILVSIPLPHISLSRSIVSR